MQCKDVRRSLLEGWPQDTPESIRSHLSACPECSICARDWGLLRAGFQALASEPTPEPSWGFTARLLRRLEEVPGQAAFTEGFLERVGRRVVYAAGVLALMLLLVLALPSSGPLRGPTAAELYSAQTESATVGNNSLFADEPAEGFEVQPGTSENGGIEKKQ